MSSAARRSAVRSTAVVKRFLALSVVAEFDEIWRATYRADYLGQLVDPVAVPVRKLRHVAGAVKVDCCWVIACSAAEGSAMIRAPLPRAISRAHSARLAASIPSPSMRCAVRRSGFTPAQRDVLVLQAGETADLRVDVEFGQALIGDLGPALTPALNHLVLDRTFRPKPFSSTARMVSMNSAHGAWACRPLAMSQTHIEIGVHAPIDEFVPNEVAGQFDPLSLCHLAWNGEFHLAGKLRILADLDASTSFQSRSRSLHSLGAFRQHHLGTDDAALGGKILVAAEPAVAPAGGAVAVGG